MILIPRKLSQLRSLLEDCAGNTPTPSMSSPGSLPEAAEIVPMSEPFADRFTDGTSKSSTTPWEEKLLSEAVLAPRPSDYSLANVGDPRKAITAERPEEQCGTPTNGEEAPDCESMVKMDASDFRPQAEGPTGSVKPTQEEIGALHLFLRQVMPSSEKGFRDTAPELAR